MAIDRLINSTQGDSIIAALGSSGSIAQSLAIIAAKSNTPYNSDNKLNPSFIAYDTTHAAVTEAQRAQIGTNTTNITWNTNNGVKNLFNLTKASGTYSTVIFTVNSDKTVTVNGTASPSNSVFYLDDWTCTKAGTYVVSGAPSGGSWAPSPDTYRIRVAVNGTWKGDDVGNGFALTLAVGDVINLQINTSTSYTANNLVFKPMISIKSLYDVDPTYQPYALSNATITPTLAECVDNGVKKNYLYYTLDILKMLNTNGTWTGNAFTHTRGVTFTVNSDMSISVSGTNNSGSDCAFLLMSSGYSEGVRTIPTGTYIASGCPTGGSNSAYLLYFWKGKTTSPSASYSEYGNSTSVYLDYTNANAEGSNISFIVKTNNTVDFTVYPMICKSDVWDISHKYVPYAIGNAELTSKALMKQTILQANDDFNSVTSNGTYKFNGGPSNNPAGSSGAYGILLVITFDNYTMQLCYDFLNGVYYRNKVSSWSAWTKFN